MRYMVMNSNKKTPPNKALPEPRNSSGGIVVGVCTFSCTFVEVGSVKVALTRPAHQ